jgi:hypothetical protein
MKEGAGKHPGGRPPLIEGQTLERVTVTLPRELVEWAKREGDGNLSLGLRRLLEELDQLGPDAKRLVAEDRARARP